MSTVCVVMVLLSVGVVAGSARAATRQTLDVVFAADGSVTVSLPDGTPVGATSSAPTTIPAGYYTLALSGPEGCSESLYVEFHGPGVDIYGGLMNGEVANATYSAYFAPNSTYTWRNDEFPGTVYTFVTNAVIGGTAPATTPSATKPNSGGSVLVGSSQDVLGGKAVPMPYRGRLHATVTPGAHLTLESHSRRVSRLTAGTYDVSVQDRSRKDAFILQESGQPPITITTAKFEGSRTVQVELTPGKWLLEASLTGNTTSFLVAR